MAAAAPEAMTGVKREAAAGDPSPRPKKIQRVGSGSTDIACAIDLQVQIVDALKPEDSIPEPEPGLVFLNAGAEAVAALDLEEMRAITRAKDEKLLVDVPAAVHRVNISKCLILKEIVAQLGLEVFSFGIVLEDGDVYRGWVDMEIPSSHFSAVRGRKKFYSDDAFSKHDAKEGACHEAISYLRTACSVVVEDISYQEMRALQNRAIAAETMSDLLNEVLKGARIKQKAMHEAFTSFFLDAKALCMDFADVFGNGTIGMAGTSATPGEEKLYYGGPRPPITRVQELAFNLVALINRCGDAAMAAGDVD